MTALLKSRGGTFGSILALLDAARNGKGAIRKKAS
jgi:hypothetical protein